MFHPWRTLGSLPHITVIWTELEHHSALTDGVSKIWLDRRLFQVERRCSLTHELIHIERGHTRRQDPAAELSVRAETARRLIPWEELLRHKRWALSIEELADCLWVTPRVLQDRIDHLSAAERQQFLQAFCDCGAD
ncbi:ImmA/IrrE family metallo-endopeptidase [Psychromicrobium sp. YIM B11713]|uniref:ImmA/IrrE family metallo-endopeptidase n=1 Tax=Psychromicrobium sp. YIM B11713 TaxID=3145233 RepID=UPI00374FCD6C